MFFKKKIDHNFKLFVLQQHTEILSKIYFKFKISEKIFAFWKQKDL